MKLAHLALTALTASVSLSLGALALAEDAPAAGSEPRSLIARRCKDDANKLCAGIAAGDGRLAKCLRAHQAELSEPCQATLTGGRQAPVAGPQQTPPAAAPAATPRPQAAPAAPAPAAPAAPPTPTPTAAAPALTATPGETGAMMGMRRSCGDEIEKFCPDVPPGQGRIASCLNEHPKALSFACKKAVNLVMRQMKASMETHPACTEDVEKLCGEVQPGAGRIAFCMGEHSAELSPTCKQQIAELKAEGKKAAAPK